MHELDIAEVHQRTGLPPSTLRYYERRGLIRSSSRNGLRRQYHLDVIGRLATIVAAQEAGFTLTETAELLDAVPSDGGLRRRLAAKADELDRQVQVLAAMRDRLRHAARCESPRLTDCPHFRRGIEDALPHGRPQPGAISQRSR